MRRAVAVLVLVCLFPAVAAARTCTVGCSCGNTCIDCSDTCHVGSGGGGGDTAVIVGAVLGGAVGLGLIIWVIVASRPRYTAGDADDALPVAVEVSPNGAFVGVEWEF